MQRGILKKDQNEDNKKEKKAYTKGQEDKPTPADQKKICSLRLA